MKNCFLFIQFLFELWRGPRSIDTETSWPSGHWSHWMNTSFRTFQKSMFKTLELFQSRSNTFFFVFFNIQAIFVNCLKRTPVKLSWNTNKYQPISSHLHNVSIFCPFWKKWKSCVWCLQFNHQSKTQVSLCLFYKPIFPKTVICFSRRPQL